MRSCNKRHLFCSLQLLQFALCADIGFLQNCNKCKLHGLQ